MAWFAFAVILICPVFANESPRKVQKTFAAKVDVVFHFGCFFGRLALTAP
jgi:hypothetical protein